MNDPDDTTGDRDTADEAEVVPDGDDGDTDGEAVLDELFAVIEERRATLPKGSYTASLFTHEKGENRVLEKLGEEVTETILAAKDDDRAELTHEAADVVYHLLVLLAMKDVSLSDLRAELRKRR